MNSGFFPPFMHWANSNTEKGNESRKHFNSAKLQHESSPPVARNWLRPAPQNFQHYSGSPHDANRTKLSPLKEFYAWFLYRKNTRQHKSWTQLTYARFSDKMSWESSARLFKRTYSYKALDSLRFKTWKTKKGKSLNSIITNKLQYTTIN